MSWSSWPRASPGGKGSLLGDPPHGPDGAAGGRSNPGRAGRRGVARWRADEGDTAAGPAVVVPRSVRDPNLRDRRRALQQPPQGSGPAATVSLRVLPPGRHRHAPPGACAGDRLRGALSRAVERSDIRRSARLLTSLATVRRGEAGEE